MRRGRSVHGPNPLRGSAGASPPQRERVEPRRDASADPLPPPRTSRRRPVSLGPEPSRRNTGSRPASVSPHGRHAGGTRHKRSVALLAAAAAVLVALVGAAALSIYGATDDSTLVATGSPDSVAPSEDAPPAAEGAEHEAAADKSPSTGPASDEAGAPSEQSGSAGTDTASGIAEPDWEELARSIVLLWSPGCGHAGSGTIVGDGTLVLTNEHVAVNDHGAPCDLQVGLAATPNQEPDEFFTARTVLLDATLDLAMVQMLDRSGNPITWALRDPIEVQPRTLELGEEIVTLGYPGVGGNTVTLTRGDYSGDFEDPGAGRFWKTSAAMGPGVSGGAAFDSRGRFVGVPTAGSTAALDCDDARSGCRVGGSSLGLIRPADVVADWLNEALKQVRR